MGDLNELAARCESATGPDRELDAAILQSAYVLRRGQRGDLGPHYTASIDAAMTLVHADMRDEIEITTLYRVARVTINMNHGADGYPFYGENACNSIPLAICAAALKARAHQGTPS